MRLLPVLPLLVVLTACSATPAPPAAQPKAPHPPLGVSASPGPTSDLTVPRLAGLLLQDADVPDLSLGRPYAEPGLTTRDVPQLALCRPDAPTAPHAVANVLGRPAADGQASVFQVVSAYADEAAARAAYEDAVGRARTCGSYTDPAGVDLVVSGLRALSVPAPARAAQYELTTPGGTGSDARTLAQSGRFTVLISSLGTPAPGTTLRALQAAVLPKALARLTA